MQLAIVPFGEQAIVRERRGPDVRVYRESFTGNSFAELPVRVPLLRHHDRSRPVGWVALELRETGLHGDAELVDSTSAADALVESKAGLTSSVSVGFISDPTLDRWSMPGREPSKLPVVERRGVSVVEVSLVDLGCYPSAKVLGFYDPAEKAHQQSEALLAPLRREQADRAAARRRETEELLRDLDRLAAVRRTEEPLVSEQPDSVSGRTVLTAPVLTRDLHDDRVRELVRRFDNGYLSSRELRELMGQLR